MISIKSLLKTSVIYGFGSIFMRAMTFLLLPFYTNELENYGEFILVMTTIGFLRIFYSHGMGDSFLKIYSQSNNKEKITTTYLLYILFVIACFSIFFSIINLIINIDDTGSLLGLLQNKLIFIILIVLFDTINYRMIDILRIQNHAIYYMIGQITGVISTFVLTIYFVNMLPDNSIIPFINNAVEGALLAVLMGGIVTFIIFSPILFQNIKINHFSKLYLQKMISLSMRFFPAAVFFIFMELIDRYLLKLLLNVPNANDLIGTYSVGCKLASIPMLLISAFNLGWQPFYLNNGNTKDAIQKYTKVGNAFIIIMLSMSWCVSMLMPIIAQLHIPFINNYPLIGIKFIAGIEIIPIILISHVFYAMYIINMPAIYLCDKQNWSPIFRIFGAMINVILNLILIPIYGIYGAAIATAASYGSMFMLLYYKNKNWIPMKLAWKDIVSLSLIIIISIMTTSNLKITIMIFTLLYISFMLYKHGLKQIIIIFK